MVGLGVKISDISDFVFVVLFFLLGNHSCINKMYYLVLTLTVTSTVGVKCSGVWYPVKSGTS